MRKASGIAAVVAIVLAATPFAEACGDKLLSIARGIRLNQTYQASHPASMLMFVGDVTTAKRSRQEHKRLVQMSILYMSLRQAGHKIEAVQNEAELREALANKRFDFVLADQKHLGSVVVPAAGAPQTNVLPVLFKPKKSDLATAQAQFDLVLKTPATSVDHLEAIDTAMASRARATASDE